MSSLKYVKDIPSMTKIRLWKGLGFVDSDTGIIYYNSCPECKLLLSEEDAYGHDCEGE